MAAHILLSCGGECGGSHTWPIFSSGEMGYSNVVPLCYWIDWWLFKVEFHRMGKLSGEVRFEQVRTSPLNVPAQHLWWLMWVRHCLWEFIADGAPLNLLCAATMLTSWTVPSFALKWVTTFWHCIGAPTPHHYQVHELAAKERGLKKKKGGGVSGGRGIKPKRKVLWLCQNRKRRSNFWPQWQMKGEKKWQFEHHPNEIVTFSTDLICPSVGIQ